MFAIFVYVWRLMEKLDMMPQIVQQLMRLKDIRRRIEAGASVEAVGEQIQRTGSEKRGPPRRHPDQPKRPCGLGHTCAARYGVDEERPVGRDRLEVLHPADRLAS